YGPAALIAATRGRTDGSIRLPAQPPKYRLRLQGRPQMESGHSTCFEMSMPSPDTLRPFINDDPSDFATLAGSCGNVIDAWLAEGGEPTDDEVIRFYSLWSQSLDARGSDESGFFRWAYPLFLESRDEARARIEQT
ncbi:MAG: hypothetical protein ABIO43_00020, partial [Sphingomicrobium sp.]